MKLLETAIGDPLGGCRITPHGYSVMLKKVAFQLNLYFFLCMLRLCLSLQFNKFPISIVL